MNRIKKHGKPPCIFKYDISLTEYTRLFNTYYQRAKEKEMIYLYFDTDNRKEKAELFNSNVRLKLRVREEADYSLELKSKISYPSEDLFQFILIPELELLIQGCLPDGKIKDKLSDLNLLQQVLWINTSHVKRLKILFHDGVLVLERTANFNLITYQVEFRSDKLISNYKRQIIKNELNLYGRLKFCSKLKQIWAA